MAVGSLGRGDVAPYGDLDLLIVHNGQWDVREAEEIWYPLWDSGIALDHAVRTIDETLRLAESDIAVALGLLDARTIAGDEALGADLTGRAREAWRRSGKRVALMLKTASAERTQRFGELAFEVEPDLKQARGGLRDVLALHGLSVAQLTDPVSGEVASAYELLLDVRTALHQRVGRSLDRLVRQEHDPVAKAMGLPDGDVLLRLVSDAGRSIGFAWDTAIRRIETRPAVRWPRRKLVRRPLADSVVEQDGEVVLARDADVSDPTLPLRVAAASARADLPISPYTLDQLAQRAGDLPVPWPAAARDALMSLLGAGRPAVEAFEALDRAGLLTRMLPEWEHVRSRPQHDPIHRFTVDRHLIETAVHAAERIRSVRRPDVLLMSALLHDIGKGLPGDHSEAGAEVAVPLARRMGFNAGDVELIGGAVRHHLLLPDTATRRDLDDPATIAGVINAVGGSRQLLDVLHSLSYADGLATGPGVWSNWKRYIIDELVDRVRRAMDRDPAPVLPRLSAQQRALAAEHDVAVLVHDAEVTVSAPDSTGLLSRTAGVLALHRLDVRSADVVTEYGVAVDVFVTEPRFGDRPDPKRLEADLLRALRGDLPVSERLASMDRSYRPGAPVAPPAVLWFDDAATDATVVELRTANSIGLLHRVTAALESCGLDIRAARVSTTGDAVVDAFYVVGSAGRPVEDPARRRRVETALLRAAELP